MKNDEEIPTADTTQIEHLIERVKQGKLDQGDAQLIEKVLRTFLTLVSLLERKNTSIRRLKRLLFGSKERKTSKNKANDSPETRGSGEEEKPQTGTSNERASISTSSDSTAEGESSSQTTSKPKKPGHGRKPASAYTGAKIVKLAQQKLSPGDCCPNPDCRGHLHKLKKPKTKLYLTGHPLISATKYERQVLRCSGCFNRFVTELPEGVKEKEKFDETADVAIALYKYGGGLPFFRQARMQESCGVPLPESVQFERCEIVAKAVLAVYLYLYRLAANGKVFHIDDTKVRILSCFQEDKDRSEKERHATHTSGIVSKLEVGRKIALYFSSRQHAGENLDDVLTERAAQLPVPIKVSDASSVNGKMKAKTIEGYCLAHGDRKFKEIEVIFPVECERVLEAIREVYRHDAETKAMNDEERLEYHQKHSGPVMKQLYEWIEEQFRERSVEPNSVLGKALQYMLNNWVGLTRFLNYPGVPIDNNEAERVLKRFVLFRKNSLFYKTLHGAAIGGILMSLIETCRLNQVNPWEYLLFLMRNKAEAGRNPFTFLPWNYAGGEAVEERAA